MRSGVPASEIASVPVSPADMRYDPGAHQLASEAWQAWYDEHEFDGFRHYRSPFADAHEGPPSMSSAHYMWADAVESYTKDGKEFWLNQALSVVTPDNPPRAGAPIHVVTYTDGTMTIEHREPPKYNPDPDLIGYLNEPRRWTGRDIALVSSILFVALTVAGVFGGFKAFAAVSVILFLIFAISWIVHD